MADKIVIEDQGTGRFRVSGPLTFDTVADAATTSQKLFVDRQVVDMDLSGVTASDSAGLALLIEWISRAQRSQCRLSYSRVPEQVMAIAKISDVDKLLPIAT